MYEWPDTIATSLGFVITRQFSGIIRGETLHWVIPGIEALPDSFTGQVVHGFKSDKM